MTHTVSVSGSPLSLWAVFWICNSPYIKNISLDEVTVPRIPPLFCSPSAVFLEDGAGKWTEDEYCYAVLPWAQKCGWSSQAPWRTQLKSLWTPYWWLHHLLWWWKNKGESKGIELCSTERATLSLLLQCITILNILQLWLWIGSHQKKYCHK